MFGAILGYLMCTGAALFAIGLPVYGCIKYSDLPESQKDGAHCLLMIIVPFIINILYTILAFTMMIVIPSFPWWMVLIFIAITTGNFYYWMPQMFRLREIGTFILLFVKIPESVMAMVLVCLIVGEILGWIVKKMINAKKAKIAETAPANEEKSAEKKE